MSYSLFLDKVLYPVPPSKITQKIKNQNKTISLINDGQINFLKAPGLREIQFDLLLPQTRYPFAVYEGGFKKAEYFLEKLKDLKENKKTFQFLLSRVTPDYKLLFDTDMPVSLEEYQITEDAKNGLDITVTVKLKEYKDYGTQTTTTIHSYKQHKGAIYCPG